MVPNDSTFPAPNALSRRISFGVHAAVLLMLVAGQLLIVIGAEREGMGRAGLIAALATPLIAFVRIVFFPDDSEDMLGDFQYAVSKGEWRFALLLLAVAPVSATMILWLTRRAARERMAIRHR